jgi:biopolymer transport protein ExbD
MRIRDFRADDTPEINLIPLIDVVLCLIVFFVVTTTFDSRSVLKLQLPRAQGEPATQQAEALDILVNADGRYFVGDREALRTDVESLKRTIAEVAGDDRKRIVLLRADARTPHQAVVTALDALGQLGFRDISIGTAPEPGTRR